MGLTRRLGLALALAIVAAAPATGTGTTPAGWDRMKSLVGDWRGTEEGHPMAVAYALVSGGTAELVQERAPARRGEHRLIE